ncbi:GntR family transcriptional regulator [Alkalihalobacterium sp. APHAB7]|uniref:GntR family transcriptional regulator n=1 Tax=Alkalihalobacterium sp. APHAB7 TaxID=3402081 RepID=UPI003AAABA03
MKKSDRTSDKVEKKLIDEILTGKLHAGSALPPERELAKTFSVGRPTVREALQRLERDGWITARKGQPSIVNNYWSQGNLTMLVSIVQNQQSVTDEFILYLLELRCSLTPTYIRDAVTGNQAKVVALLAHLEDLKDDADTYAAFDWKLQKEFASLSPNPIYLLILNSFDSFYLPMATRYFSIEAHRKLSLQYYNELLTIALKGDSIEAEKIARKVMERSLTLWKDRKD